MSGIHHVTAIAGNPLRNFDFYTRALGVRFVKRTVNFDDPGTYHFYYGDETGSPGTILTFFSWETAGEGRNGVGQTQQTAFRVPARSLGYWTHRFIEKGIAHEALEKRFGESVLPFTDPDGMSLALVGVPGAENEAAWSNGDVPAEHAIRGFHGVTLLLEDAAKTGAILTEVFGFKETSRDGSMIRFRAPGTGRGASLTSMRPKNSCRHGRAAARCTMSRSAPSMTQTRPRWRASLWRNTASIRRSRRIVTTSARSIFANPAACCSRSQPISPDLRSMNRSSRSARN